MMERLQARLQKLSVAFACCLFSGSLAIAAAIGVKRWRRKRQECIQSCDNSLPEDRHDHRQLPASTPLSDLLTVVLTTSAIPSHPSTYLLDEKQNKTKQNTCVSVSRPLVLKNVSHSTKLNREGQRQLPASTPLSDLLTVVLTTSAIPSHPSTYLLDETLKSMSLANGVQMCPLIITCDGYKQCAEGVESRCRMGIVNPDLARRYEEYKQKLRDRQAQGEFELLELVERHGFGFAVRATLPQVKTPYVLIMQHDRAFVRSVDVEQLVWLMEEHERVKYLGMPTATTLHHQYHVLSKYGIRVAAEEVAPGLTITPLIQWYDSAHLARTDYYRNFVFGSKHLVARGGFIEDKLGQKQLHDIRTLGLEAHKEFGTYILNDSVDEPMVLHLDGRDSRHLAHAR